MSFKLELSLPNFSTEARRRFDYALGIAPSILAIHPTITRVVLFAGVADGVARLDSDIDLATLYSLTPNIYTQHQELLKSFRRYKKTLIQKPFVVHLVILSETDIQEGAYPTSRNIREKGITLCHR